MLDLCNMVNYFCVHFPLFSKFLDLLEVHEITSKLSSYRKNNEDTSISPVCLKIAGTEKSNNALFKSSYNNKQPIAYQLFSPQALFGRKFQAANGMQTLKEEICQKGKETFSWLLHFSSCSSILQLQVTS